MLSSSDRRCLVHKKAFELTGRVENVLVSNVYGETASAIVRKIQLLRGSGVRGDKHAGPRLVDVRETDLLRFGISKGVEIANYREVTIISKEEIASVAEGMDIPSIPAGCLGENIIVSGIPSFTQLPIGTKLCFKKRNGSIRTAVVAVWGENGPCIVPGKVIQDHYPDQDGLALQFPKAAMGRRGIIGAVYCSGFVCEGDIIIAMVPPQNIYSP